MQKKLAAEFFGTFWLVLGGCGAAVFAAGFPTLGIGFAGVALAFGLTVLTMVYAVGHISGGHFNPAVSVGLAVAGRFSWGELIPYVIAQVVGAIAGAIIIYLDRIGQSRLLARQRLRRQWLWRAFAGQVSDGFGAHCRDRAHRLLPDRDPGRDQQKSTGGLCRHRHRPGADA